MKSTLRDFLISSFDCADETIEHAADVLGLRDISELVESGKSDLLFPQFEARFPERIRAVSYTHLTLPTILLV